MGGHSRGQWASAAIARALEAATLAESFDAATDGVAAALQAANDQIYAAAAEARDAIGSTVAALLIRSTRCMALWAGDSRIYLCRQGALRLLTTDHSHVEQMVAAGILTREEAENHPMAHVLSHAVGVRVDLALDRISEDVLPGDTFLLCSDGLTRSVPADEIARLLAAESPHRAAVALVDLALDRGAADNVTVVVVGCDATTLIDAG